jgi:endonuclease/exonuclease/phosphatase family metal-dependent hydrolase
MLNWLLALVILLSGCMTYSQGTMTPPRQLVKVLTINLCANWNAPRQDRADAIVSFCREEQVDIILTQEGIKGIGQFDMAKYIAGQLGYSYCQSPSFGVPGFLEYCVGIISTYSIKTNKKVGCQVSGGDPIDRVPFPGAARGLLANVGGINVMTSHLTVPVMQSAKEEQVSCLRAALPKGVSIWGGDFNFNRYDLAYPMVELQEALYVGPPQVDMIFFGGLSLVESRLVFEDHFVSDHCGVLATFRRYYD